MPALWKDNWEESRRHYLDWWAGKGLVISMWEHLRSDAAPHAQVSTPGMPPQRHPESKAGEFDEKHPERSGGAVSATESKDAAPDWNQYWFDAGSRAARIHYELAHSSLKADILPVANTHLGPGSLAAILGSELEGAEDTIWIHPAPHYDGRIVLDENNRWWRLHLDLVRACRRLSGDDYFVGCPDLIEGLDTLASLRGTQPVLMDMVDRPDGLAEALQAVNDVWFEVFDRIYDEINVGGEMAFCYFSIWGPGKVAKLQSDISGMLSPRAFRRFVQPYIREQCGRLDYSLYHLDGVDAMRHLPALLEIEKLNAIQWTPGVGQPQGGDPCWYDLYRRIRAAGKSIMATWVELDELAPLLDAIGPAGTSVLMNFHTESDIDTALKIAEHYYP